MIEDYPVAVAAPHLVKRILDPGRSFRSICQRVKVDGRRSENRPRSMPVSKAHNIILASPGNGGEVREIEVLAWRQVGLMNPGSVEAEELRVPDGRSSNGVAVALIGAGARIRART